MPKERELFREMYLPEGAEYEAPEGIPIFRPFQALEEFWPASQPERLDWLIPHERRHLIRLAHNIATIFGVPLCNDAQYEATVEDEKATSLFCVLTRGQLQETRPGIFTWNPICVVVRYCVMAAVRCQLDAANSHFWILDARIWSRKYQCYEPVLDDRAGWIKNPHVLLHILEMYAAMEGFGAPAPGTP